MKAIKKAVVTNGKYMKDGQEKTRYLTVGKLLQRDDGSVCLKLDALPVGGDFEGWINFYDLDEDRQQAPAQAAPTGVSEDVPF
jgi:hypothetical protein